MKREQYNKLRGVLLARARRQLKQKNVRALRRTCRALNRLERLNAAC
jgi:hypothetical protein